MDGQTDIGDYRVTFATENRLTDNGLGSKNSIYLPKTVEIIVLNLFCSKICAG